MLLKLMQLYVPGFVKKRELKRLFRLTADAFQSDLPELRGLSFAECLSKYARFTKERAESYLQSGCPLDEIRQRLYQSSRAIGQNLRRNLHVVTWEQSVMALKAIYRLIGIELQCDRHGEVTVKQCFFSKYYSGAVCRLISSLDEGLAAGLSDGGKLAFSQRLTEGGSCCKGYLLGGPSR